MAVWLLDGGGEEEGRRGKMGGGGWGMKGMGAGERGGECGEWVIGDGEWGIGMGDRGWERTGERGVEGRRGWEQGGRTFTAVEAGPGGLRSVARFEAVGAVGGLAGVGETGRGVRGWGGGRGGAGKDGLVGEDIAVDMVVIGNCVFVLWFKGWSLGRMSNVECRMYGDGHGNVRVGCGVKILG